MNARLLVVFFSLFLLMIQVYSNSNGGVPKAQDHSRIGVETPDSTLVELLGSADGSQSAKATAEAFRRGKAIIPALEQAGAKPMATVNPPRLDVVYTLLKATPTGNYLTNSFGLHLRGQPSREDVVRLGKKHGFVLPENVPVRPGASPNCYVRLLPGKSLFDVIRSLLKEEPGVSTINLNYTES